MTRRAPPGNISDVDRVFYYIMVAYFTVAFGLMGLIIFTEARLFKKRRKAVSAFLRENPELTPEELEIVDGYRRGWGENKLSLVRAVLRGEEAVDLSEFLKKRFDSLTHNPFARMVISVLPFLKERFSTPTFDPRLFRRDGLSIQLNPENSKLVRSLLEHVGDLDNEKTSNKIPKSDSGKAAADVGPTGVPED